MEFSAEPDTRTNVPSFPLGVYSFLKQSKTVLMWLAIPINAHQNANQKPIGSAPAYQVQYTLPPQPIYQTLPRLHKALGAFLTTVRLAEHCLLVTNVKQGLAGSDTLSLATLYLST